MQDVEFELENRPGALAELGEAMGRAGVAFEGGGVFLANGRGIAHFLFRDGEAASRAAETEGIRVVAVRNVVVRKLTQGSPGQLGAISRALANANVNIIIQYSDHDNRLILVTDDFARAAEVTAAWSP